MNTSPNDYDDDISEISASMVGNENEERSEAESSKKKALGQATSNESFENVSQEKASEKEHEALPASKAVRYS